MAGRSDLLAAAGEARLRAQWARARDLYAQMLAADPEDADALDGLGRTSWWVTGGWLEALELRQRAYAAFRRRGDGRRAGGAAVALAEASRIEGKEAAARGWLARAERLLADAGECGERGWLAIEQAKRTTDPWEHAGHAGRALDLARRLDDGDLEMAALAHLGLARTLVGRVETGMALLDEAMAAATGGESRDPLAIGETCCMTLLACEQWDDFRRAAEWCRVVVEFTDRHHYTPLAAWCRTVYAGVLIDLGEWPRAEEQLSAALRAYGRLEHGRRVHALALLAELRLREGRLEEAERFLEGSSGHPIAARAAIGLDLVRGETELAAERLELQLARLPAGGPALSRLLFLAAEVHLACGELDRAGASAVRLRELGHRLGREQLLALAELAAGKVAARRGDTTALGHLQTALDHFERLGMEFHAARARLESARVQANSSPHLAATEARAALLVFERLGAARDADLGAQLLRSLGVPGRTAVPRGGRLTRREEEVLELLAEGLSNAAIGTRLFITRRTAEHHVANVLAKLGLRNRTEAAAYAWRAGPSATARLHRGDRI